jgi:arylsulfatase A-like enzyme
MIRPVLLALSLLCLMAAMNAGEALRPNLVIILADDMGPGEVGAYGAGGPVHTPHLDRLAAEGLRFTQATCPAAICSPTRYALLTGRYPWRTALKSDVLGGAAPPLIEADRPTIASVAAGAGYRTACIGKWHLGLDWPQQADVHPTRKANDLERMRAIDFSAPLLAGPGTLGFERAFILPATAGYPPYVWIDQDCVVTRPDREAALFQKALGPAAPDFRHEDLLTITRDRAVAWLQEQSPGRPFLLYLPLTAPHTPVAPSATWRDRAAHPYLAYVQEMDAAIGAVLACLDQRNLAADTLVIFTADNGYAREAVDDNGRLAGLGYTGVLGLRGSKGSLHEGGTRVPFLARWPGQIAPGGISPSLIGLQDIFATVAELVGARSAMGGEDSHSLLPVLRDATAVVRTRQITASYEGHLALREGNLKLLWSAGSGSWVEPREEDSRKQKRRPPQLYDLAADPGETRNLAQERPADRERLREQLVADILAGRTTPGPASANQGQGVWPAVKDLPGLSGPYSKRTP